MLSKYFKTTIQNFVFFDWKTLKINKCKSSFIYIIKKFICKFFNWNFLRIKSQNMKFNEYSQTFKWKSFFVDKNHLLKFKNDDLCFLNVFVHFVCRDLTQTDWKIFLNRKKLLFFEIFFADYVEKKLRYFDDIHFEIKNASILIIEKNFVLNLTKIFFHRFDDKTVCKFFKNA